MPYKNLFFTIPIFLATSHMVYADGFGPGFQSGYQFRSDNERAVRSGVTDLIERKTAGMFQAPIFNSTTTTNIAGDQVNCDVVATTIGNSAGSVIDGTSGAPSVLNSPDVSAEAAGNLADGEAGGALSAGGEGGGGSNVVNTTQDVEGSSQTSSVGTSEQGGVSGNVGGSQSRLEQVSSNAQDFNSSALNSSVSRSSACSWY